MSPSFDVLSLAAVPGRRSRFGGKAASGGHGFRATCGSLESLVPRGLARSRRRKTQWGTQLKGRYYSPAWHCFLNSDQGADPKQWSQYAYTGGNPMVNTDPSGMSWLSSLCHDISKDWHKAWNGIGRDVRWDQNREGAECVIAAAAIIGTDIATAGALTPFEVELMDAGMGAAAGGMIGGNIKGAIQGAIIGYSIGMGATWTAGGIAAGNTTAAAGGKFWSGFESGFGGLAKAGLADSFGPADDAFGWGMKALAGGMINSAFNKGNVWLNFRNGAMEGGTLGAFGFDFPADETLEYLGTQGLGEWIYRSWSNKPTHITDFPVASGFGNAIVQSF